MFRNDPRHVAEAAEHLSALLPPATRDDVSVSTYLRRPDQMILMVILPTRLSHLRRRLPNTIDGVEIAYQVSDPLSLN